MSNKCPVYLELYLISLSQNKKKLIVEKVKDFEDNFSWVNKEILSKGEMFVTKDKIEWGKEKVLDHLTKIGIK